VIELRADYVRTGPNLVWSGLESVIEYIPTPNPGVEGRHPITNYVPLSGKTHRVLRERGRRGLAWDELGRQCSTVFSKAVIHSGGARQPPSPTNLEEPVWRRIPRRGVDVVGGCRSR
jgi:hypothetical protein